MATPTSLPASFTSGQVLTAAQQNNLRGAFRILQVASTIKTDTFSASVAASGEAEVTGLSVSITPRENTSKILVIASIGKGTYGGLRLKRDTTTIANADAASNRTRSSAISLGTNGDNPTNVIAQVLDSPATTSAITYKVFLAQTITSTASLYLNRGDIDNDNAGGNRTVSTITVLEVSA